MSDRTMIRYISVGLSAGFCEVLDKYSKRYGLRWEDAAKLILEKELQKFEERLEREVKQVES